MLDFFFVCVHVSKLTMWLRGKKHYIQHEIAQKRCHRLSVIKRFFNLVFCPSFMSPCFRTFTNTRIILVTSVFHVLFYIKKTKKDKYSLHRQIIYCWLLLNEPELIWLKGMYSWSTWSQDCSVFFLHWTILPSCFVHYCVHIQVKYTAPPLTLAVTCFFSVFLLKPVHRQPPCVGNKSACTNLICVKCSDRVRYHMTCKHLHTLYLFSRCFSPVIAFACLNMWPSSSSRMDMISWCKQVILNSNHSHITMFFFISDWVQSRFCLCIFQQAAGVSS